MGSVAENRIVREGFARDRKRFKPLESAELVGVTDIRSERKGSADSLGLAWFDSAEDIFGNRDVDAVMIATDNPSHYPLARRAIEAGKHCLIEKPMTTRCDDALDLRNLARSRRISLSVNHPWQYNAFNVLSRRLLSAGRIGKVQFLCLHMEVSYGATDDEAASWRCSRPDALGGPIGDLGSHCFYMAEFLLAAKIAKLSCIYYPRTLDIAVENGAYIRFVTENGTDGSIRVAFSESRGGLLSSLLGLGYEAYGADGVLRSFASMFQLSGHEDEPAPVRVEVEDEKGTEHYTVARNEIRNIYQSSILRHAGSILSGELLDGTEGVHNVQLIARAHESARKSGSQPWM
jgi:predicted dehydrogenase